MKRILVAAALLASARAHADDAPATYAIVVGSNTGGAGQSDLRYAEDDARRVGALLTELGGYSADQVDVIVHPTPDVVRERITKLAERVAADMNAGRQSRVFFYYSGHAKATAIDLGTEELPLEELRMRLFQVPATLTVVVLDACQSGAFSRVKGATPAADFSFNSRQHLDATGVAVLASSSGSELSQESEQLKSSYFTHHLLVGLRGAGDENGDGQVTLDEAYRYAYHQTLLATAETAVGGQHVTFEADLKGHGDIPLSYPRAATQSIELPAALEGQTLVEDKKAKVVVAETYKAKGAAVKIAVAPGEYRVVVRHGQTVSRCELSAGGIVDMDRCTTEQLVQTATKGGFDPGFGGALYRVEVSFIVGGERDDAYTQNLTTFGYHEDASNSTGIQVLALRHVSPYVWVGVQGAQGGMPEWQRDTEQMTQTLDWSLTTFEAVGRADLPLNGDDMASKISIYGQLGGGFGVGKAHVAGAQGEDNTHYYGGPAVSAAAGLHFEMRSHVGLSLGYQFDYAPVIDDRIGHTHASGGHRIGLGLSYGF